MLRRENFEVVSRYICAAHELDPDEVVFETVQPKLHDVKMSEAYVVEPGPKMERWKFIADNFLAFAASQSKSG